MELAMQEAEKAMKKENEVQLLRIKRKNKLNPVLNGSKSMKEVCKVMASIYDENARKNQIHKYLTNFKKDPKTLSQPMYVSVKAQLSQQRLGNYKIPEILDPEDYIGAQLVNIPLIETEVKNSQEFNQKMGMYSDMLQFSKLHAQVNIKSKKQQKPEGADLMNKKHMQSNFIKFKKRSKIETIVQRIQADNKKQQKIIEEQNLQQELSQLKQQQIEFFKLKQQMILQENEKLKDQKVKKAEHCNSRKLSQQIEDFPQLNEADIKKQVFQKVMEEQNKKNQELINNNNLRVQMQMGNQQGMQEGRQQPSPEKKNKFIISHKSNNSVSSNNNNFQSNLGSYSNVKQDPNIIQITQENDVSIARSQYQKKGGQEPQQQKQNYLTEQNQEKNEDIEDMEQKYNHIMMKYKMKSKEDDEDTFKQQEKQKKERLDRVRRKLGLMNPKEKQEQFFQELNKINQKIQYLEEQTQFQNQPIITNQSEILQKTTKQEISFSNNIQQNQLIYNQMQMPKSRNMTTRGQVKRSQFIAERYQINDVKPRTAQNSSQGNQRRIKTSSQWYTDFTNSNQNQFLTEDMNKAPQNGDNNRLSIKEIFHKFRQSQFFDMLVYQNSTVNDKSSKDKQFVEQIKQRIKDFYDKVAFFQTLGESQQNQTRNLILNEFQEIDNLLQNWNCELLDVDSNLDVKLMKICMENNDYQADLNSKDKKNYNRLLK